MTKKAGVYQIINEINGKSYIGSSIDILNRWRQWRSFCKSNKIKYKSLLVMAFQKYGVENFTFSILVECQPVKEILERFEQHFIDLIKPKYNLLPKAYTMAGYRFPEAHKQKLRENYSDERKKRTSIRATAFMNLAENKAIYSALRKGKTFTEIFGDRATEVLAKQSKNRTGKHVGFTPWNKGIPMPMALRQKLSAILKALYAAGRLKSWNKGIKTGHTPWNKGKPWSDAMKRRLSIAHLGQTPGNKGVLWTSEQKQKQSKIAKENFDPVHQRKMTEAARLVNLGKPRSEETKKKIGDAHRGIPSELLGIPRTAEVKQKVSDALKSSEKAKTFHQGRIGKSRGNNPSGHYGVIWDKTRNKWQTRIQGKLYGRFEQLEDAIRKAKEVMCSMKAVDPIP